MLCGGESADAWYSLAIRLLYKFIFMRVYCIQHIFIVGITRRRNMLGQNSLVLVLHTTSKFIEGGGHKPAKVLLLFCLFLVLFRASFQINGILTLKRPWTPSKFTEQDIE